MILYKQVRQMFWLYNIEYLYRLWLDGGSGKGVGAEYQCNQGSVL